MISNHHMGHRSLYFNGFSGKLRKQFFAKNDILGLFQFLLPMDIFNLENKSKWVQPLKSVNPIIFQFWLFFATVINVWIMSFGQVVDWQNLHWSLNILVVVVFLNCSCEINFEAPLRYRKGCMILIQKFHSDFFDTAKNKQVNKQSNFDTNFYICQPVQMTWSIH